MNEISFPGLGIGPFEIDSVAFSLFGHDVMWYGVIISIGMVLAFFYARHRAKYEGIRSDDILDLALVLIVFSIIGARLYYVAFTFPTYIATGGNFFQNLGRTLLNIISIWNGGLAIFGGIIAGFFTSMIFARKKKIRFPVLLDVLAPSVMIGQIIGRWGNFMNGEAYGSVTALPWRMGINHITANGLYSSYSEVHPTFLYESVWNLIGFVIISLFYKKKKFNGQVFYFYMIWYGLGRFFVEGLRTDSLVIAGNENLRVSQILAALIFAAGVALTVYFWKKASASEAAKKVCADDAQNDGETAASAEINAEADSADCASDIKNDGDKNDGSSD